MFYFKNIFLVSPKRFLYIEQPTRVFIMIARGIIGGVLFYLLLNYIHLGIRWEMVTGSPWFYFIMFMIGVWLCNVFATAFMILLPLDAFGLLPPIVAWIKDMLIFVIGIIALLFIGLASFFRKAPNYSSME